VTIFMKFTKAVELKRKDRRRNTRLDSPTLIEGLVGLYGEPDASMPVDTSLAIGKVFEYVVRNREGSYDRL
jgi:hypothetical protein